jgi:hypothetical protein
VDSNLQKNGKDLFKRNQVWNGQHSLATELDLSIVNLPEKNYFTSTMSTQQQTFLIHGLRMAFNGRGTIDVYSTFCDITNM